MLTNLQSGAELLALAFDGIVEFRSVGGRTATNRVFAGGASGVLAVEGGGMNVAGTNWAQAFIGDGSGLTGISSNSLDGPTAAQLAKAGAGTVASLTNTVFRVSTPKVPQSIAVTNAGQYLGVTDDYTNRMALVFHNNTSVTDTTGPFLIWEGDSLNDAGLYNWPGHGVGASEFLMYGRGSICFSSGLGGSAAPFRGYQFGIEGAPRSYVYMQHSGAKATNAALYTSIPILFKANYVFNGNTYNAGTASSADDQIYMGLYGEAMGANGDGSVSFMDGFDTRWNKWTNNWTTEPRFRVRASPDTARGGISARGGIVINGAPGLTTNYALADGNTLCFSSGMLTAIVASPSYWDVDATNWLTRISTGLTTALATNINTFVKALKVDGTWTNLEALYPFAGANGATNGQNLVSSAYTIKWSGAMATNDATGVHNGGSVYGDTQWQVTNQVAGTVFSWVKVGVVDAAWHAIWGARSGSSWTRLAHDDTASGHWLCSLASDTTVMTVSSNLVVKPASICVTRSGGTLTTYANGSATYVGSSENTAYAPEALNVWLFGNNNGGSLATAWTGKLQGWAASNATLKGTQYKTLHGAFVALNTALGR